MEKKFMPISEFHAGTQMRTPKYAQKIIEGRIHTLKELLPKGAINHVAYKDNMKILRASLNQAKGGK